jgi:hypothetical protein
MHLKYVFFFLNVANLSDVSGKNGVSFVFDASESLALLSL